MVGYTWTEQRFSQYRHYMKIKQSRAPRGARVPILLKERERKRKEHQSFNKYNIGCTLHYSLPCDNDWLLYYSTLVPSL